jgi:hypothetical protein
MYIKKIISYQGSDISFKIPISSRNDIIGSDNDTNKLSDIISEPLINSITDYEVIRYKYGIPDITINDIISVYFYYYDYNLFVYSNNPTALGFTELQLTSNDPTYLNSFFIFDIYNSNNVLTQNRLYRTYKTKFYSTSSDINSFLSNFALTTNQLNSIFIPSYLIDQTITRFYGKFMFYNALKNNISVFYNKFYDSVPTTDKMFFPIDIDHNTKTWCFANVYNTTNSYLNAYEIIATNNTYITKVNNTSTGFNVKHMLAPTGSTFNYNTIRFT